jgi:hypothetical protein
MLTYGAEHAEVLELVELENTMLELVMLTYADVC